MNKTILLHNSHWTNNIGNAFFTLGVKYLLEKAFNEKAAIIQTSQVNSLAWHQPRSLILKNDLTYAAYSEPDWFVLAGPMFKIKALNKFTPVLEKVFTDNNKTKLVIFNAGSIDYNDEEVSLGREFLKRFKPYLFTSRDEFTYNNYHDLAEYSYNGFDTAFFANDYYTQYETPKLTNYCTFTFDNIVEPIIQLKGFDSNDSSTWDQVKIKYRSNKFFRINKYLDLLRNLPDEIDGKKIIRPSQKIQDKSVIELFRNKNSFVSQTPFAYLNLYSNTSLTISDRVHACIPTLAFGNPAMLTSSTNRKALFSRLKLDHISEKVVKMNQEYLKREKKQYLKFLESIPL